MCRAVGNDDFLSDDKQHELLGADYLEKRFPDEVVGAIRLHVPAKRYLCQAVAGYWDALSAASKRSLEVQGGTHTEEEARAFIAQPYAAEAARLRQWDDLGKRAGVVTPTLESYLGGAVSRTLGIRAA